MADRALSVLFLCTGNTARTVIAESLPRHEGQVRFNSFSAGSQRRSVINPSAVKVLATHGYPLGGLRSKSWTEFAGADAPRMDFIFTVCDGAARVACPIWPGHPATAHWGIEDPAAAEGIDIDKERAFEQAFQLMRSHIRAFVGLPLQKLYALSLQNRIKDIGRMGGATSALPTNNTRSLSHVYI